MNVVTTAALPITEKVEQLFNTPKSKEIIYNTELINFQGPSVRAVRETFEKRPDQ